MNPLMDGPQGPMGQFCPCPMCQLMKVMMDSAAPPSPDAGMGAPPPEMPAGPPPPSGPPSAQSQLSSKLAGPAGPPKKKPAPPKK